MTATGAARLAAGNTDAADASAFVERSRDDRHHFRFIVSPEDAAELADPVETRRT